MKRRSFLALLGLAPVAAASGAQAAAASLLAGPRYATGGFVGFNPRAEQLVGIRSAGESVIRGTFIDATTITATSIQVDPFQLDTIVPMKHIGDFWYPITLQGPCVRHIVSGRSDNGRIRCRVVETNGDHDGFTHEALAGYPLRQF